MQRARAASVDAAKNFELRCFLRDVGQTLPVRSDLLFAIYDELAKAGIGIPFPQREINTYDTSKSASRAGFDPGNEP